MSNRAKWIGRLIFWPFFLWLVFVVAQNPAHFRYRVVDWWRLHSYEAPANVAQLADQTTLTARGRDIFYASHPEIDDKETFNQNCQFAEKTLVLGCYAHDRIFVLDITLPDLEPVEPVTAAHEMLHAAWARMGKKDQERIGKLVNDEYARSQDAHLKELVQEYQQSGDDDPDVITNELHSILPTEIGSLSAELETYYQQYFTNRSQVVGLYNSYEAVFKSHEQSLDGLKKEIDGLYTSIQAQEKSLAQKKAVIDANNARLQQLAAANDAAGYNSLAATQRQLINEYNAQVRAYNSMLDSYKAKIEQYKAAALRYDNLIQSINSKAQTIQ